LSVFTAATSVFFAEMSFASLGGAKMGADGDAGIGAGEIVPGPVEGWTKIGACSGASGVWETDSLPVVPTHKTEAPKSIATSPLPMIAARL
jgi:hypothetical protein